MRNAFYGCVNFKPMKRINIFSSNITDATNCYYRTGINSVNAFKEIHLPFTYDNGINTKTFNSFVSAGYLYNNGVSTGRDNTIIFDLVT